MDHHGRQKQAREFAGVGRDAEAIVKKSTVTLVIGCFVLTVSGIADAAEAAATAPSAVNEIEQLTKPLAGTLFFDPIQRARMDRMRKHPVEVSGSDGAGDGVFPAPTSSVVNGFVKRSDGQSVVWVDGEARYNVKSANMALLQPSDVGGANNSVVLNLPNESVKAPVPAKVRAKKISPRNAVRKPVRKRAAAKP